MKHLFLLLVAGCLFWVQADAQLRLNVNGDAQILGKLNLDSGNANLFMGVNAGGSNTSGIENTFIGFDAGGTNQGGSFNAFLGRTAGQSNTDGSYNTFLGEGAGLSNSAGSNNIFIGRTSGLNNTIGTSNIFLGTEAGASNIDGYSNIAVGTRALLINTHSSRLVAIGDSALFANPYPDNTAVGFKAGYSTTSPSNTYSAWNTFVGSFSGYSEQQGKGNTFVGWKTGYNFDGNFNTFMGYGVGGLRDPNFEGSGNTIIGANFQSFGGLPKDTTNNNTIVGAGAGGSNEGNNNTFLGNSAGRLNTDGNNNTLVGYETRLSSPILSNATAIGYKANVGCNNCLVLGGLVDDAVKVGIGTNTPEDFLDVQNRRGDAAARISSTDGHSSSLKLLAGEGFGYELQYNGSDEELHLWSRKFAQNENIRMTWLKDGKVGIGTTDPAGRLDVAGNIYQNGALIHSDRRFKQNIQSIDGALERIRQLRGVAYRFRTKGFEKRGFVQDRQLGLIAQEVEAIFPELVSTRPDGYKAVNYDGLIPVLIEGIKAQQSMIEAQEKKIQDLESERRQKEQLAEQLHNQQQQIDALQSLLQQFIEERQSPANGSSYVLPLEQEALLTQNQPNPFYQNTLIRYFIPEGVQRAQILIVNPEGKVIGQVDIQEKGEGELTIKANSYPVGTYHYSLVLDGQVWATRSMVLTR